MGATSRFTQIPDVSTVLGCYVHMFVFDLPVSIVTFVVEYYGKLQKHGGINQFEVSHVFLHIFGPLKESSSRIYFRVPKTFEVPCLKNPHVRVLGFRVNVSFSCFILMVN